MFEKFRSGTVREFLSAFGCPEKADFFVFSPPRQRESRQIVELINKKFHLKPHFHLLFFCLSLVKNNKCKHLLSVKLRVNRSI